MLLSNVSVFLATSYDYIIIGGGTAGLTVAARLSEDSSINVGVLEAGQWRNEDPLVFTPGFYGFGLGTYLDWNFTSIPQVQLAGGHITQNRGKMVGGSSGLNYMLWNRAGIAEYDAWEDQLGNVGWNWTTILDYSKRTEHVNLPILSSQLEIAPMPAVLPQYHGFHGPVQTSFSRFHQPAAQGFLPALSALTGLPSNLEPMSGSNIGGYVSLDSIDGVNATRSYAATAFVKPNAARPNLNVLTGVMVTQILIDSSGRTQGVLFDTGTGENFTVRARREVVLSAGAVQSPQLLELSGVGNASMLAALGIKTLVDNPNVGENFQDHHLVPSTWEFVPGEPTGDLFTNATFLAEAQHLYDTNRTGILTSSSAHFAMLPFDVVGSSKEVADVLKIAKAEAAKHHENLREQTLAKLLLTFLEDNSVGQIEILWSPRKVVPSVVAEPGKTYLSLSAAVMHPHSRGSIHINSTSAHSPPVLDPRIYTSAADRTMIIAGVRFIQRLGAHPALAPFLAKRLAPAPGELSDAQLWKHIQANSMSVKHPIGTCAMLPREKGGVVDSKLRVYGVRGLRVVDASILPAHLAAHIQATVYAVAEKAADIIKGGM